jgi:hypothetical protein
MKSKYNSLSLGTILGLIVPIIAILLFYFGKSKTLTFIEFIDYLIYWHIYTKLLSLCVIPNLLLFFIFIWRELYYSARGVLLATFIYTFIIIGLKYLI